MYGDHSYARHVAAQDTTPRTLSMPLALTSARHQPPAMGPHGSLDMCRERRIMCRRWYTVVVTETYLVLRRHDVAEIPPLQAELTPRRGLWPRQP